MRDSPNAVMLFAAGFGTRMGTLTKDRPKPLVNVAGRALLDHALEQVDGIQPDSIVVNCHYFPDQIKTHLKDRADITLIHEDQEILETGGGLKNALPALGSGSVFTMNTDAAWLGPNPLQALLAAWEPEKMDALLLCVPLQHAVGHKGSGDFILGSEDRITYGAGDIYTGLQIIRTDRLSEISDVSFSLKLLWAKLLVEQRMFGLCYTGKWCDVGTPEGITLAENMLDQTDV
ncbi:nucleotidyltransferase family protein [Planktotalea sp.]|uniref:nucleotidyltransferase family protein n=1 Tax=Planktotalea sp. TaxID=2029877 RepID=UPI0025D7C24A|nr:nucleotidyltransferase family protein [Planktotalea sp.]